MATIRVSSTATLTDAALQELQDDLSVLPNLSGWEESGQGYFCTTSLNKEKTKEKVKTILETWKKKDEHHRGFTISD
ncbi:MAG TPA: hypothetical protein VKQ08_08185 [Cyclobacteriaceae bacterium]|nr:hypothetical protein [Cyclobacteriaceae bacterium]